MMGVAELIIVALIPLAYIFYWRGKSDAKKALIEQAAVIQAAVSSDDSDYEIGDLTIEVAPKRRAVNKPHHGQFRNFLVREGKAKFGTPKNTEANRLVVRKYLHDLCREHGLLARHICDHLDIATALVFVPSRVEILAAAISETSATAEACGQLRLFRGDGPAVA